MHRRDLSRSDRPGDRLLHRVLHGEAGDGELVNDLLSEFQNSYPIIELRQLLQANDSEVVGAGAWLASELGTDGRIVFKEMVALLRHPDTKVRYFAIDFLITNVRADDHQAVHATLDLISDEDRTVREAVLRFLSAVPLSVLRTARQVALTMNADRARLKGLGLLVDSVEADDSGAISSALHDPDAEVRLYAVAAAARMSSSDRRPLIDALESQDESVKRFAARVERGSHVKRRGLQ